MDHDFEKEFNSIAQRLSDISDPEIAIDLLAISQVVEALNEAALFLGKFVSKVISEPRGTPVDFPDELLPILPRLAQLAEATSAIAHDFVCEECAEGCDNCEDPECEGCSLEDEG